MKDETDWHKHEKQHIEIDLDATSLKEPIVDWRKEQKRGEAELWLKTSWP